MKTQLAAIFLLVVVDLVRGDDLQLLSAASSSFSQRLYQSVAANTPSSIYSPYSIHSALSMTSLGARGETATQMSQVLGLTALPGTSAHLAYQDLIGKLNAAEQVKLHTANAIFLNPNIPVEEQFVNDVRNYYLAIAENFDLAAAGGPEKVINNFVENKTEHLITNLLPPGAIDGGTVAVLVNTVFFNGTWLKQFPASRTHIADFHQLGGARTQVSMMTDERVANIKRGSAVDVLELPFVGNRFSLYIALPHDVDGITDLETSFTTPGVVDQLFEGLTGARVELSVPKFKIESSFKLGAALKQLGLVLPFEPSANFQGISQEQVSISNVLHKAIIEVKETGTVAAAATAVEVHITAVGPPPPPAFIVDHPFVFFLRDNQTKHILFQGKFSG